MDKKDKENKNKKVDNLSAEDIAELIGQYLKEDPLTKEHLDNLNKKK